MAANTVCGPSSGPTRRATSSKAGAFDGNHDEVLHAQFGRNGARTAAVASTWHAGVATRGA
jgi:hypothetical protein